SNEPKPGRDNVRERLQGAGGSFGAAFWVPRSQGEGSLVTVTRPMRGKTMWRMRLLVGLGALAAGTASLGVPTASAANGPTFRDCSLAGGLDPDFLQLFGATVAPQGALTVKPSQNQLSLEASESSDPGDNLGHVTLTATVTSPTIAAHTVSGAGTGK